MLIVSTKYGFQLKVFTYQSTLFHVIASSDLSERGNPRMRLLRSFHSLAITKEEPTVICNMNLFWLPSFLFFLTIRYTLSALRYFYNITPLQYPCQLMY